MITMTQLTTRVDRSRLSTRMFLVLLAGVLAWTPRLLADESGLIRLSGTPEEIGSRWGELNREIIISDMEATYLKPAAKEGISRETLIERSAAFVRIAEDIAPHWLEEARATARAAGVDEELYVAFIDGQSRNRFLHECTSYAASRAHAKDGTILFHKTRDNVDRPQATPIVDSALKGVNKFLTVSDASRIRCSMMVNDKGLAGSGDYPAERKKDSSDLNLPPADPQYRGLMAGTILRYIAEKASSSTEALEIIEDFVAKGYYAGGKVNGSHWLFVDREGVVLEVSNNAKHVVSKIHSKKAYFSRLNNSAAAQRLTKSVDPIDFQLFRSVSRDKSICFGSSISGLTVEIDPDFPELFTCAWVALPTRSVAFPVLMGQSGTPAALVDGTAYRLGKKSPRTTERWEALELAMHAEKEQLKEDIAASIDAGNPESVHAALLDQWSEAQAGRLLKLLQPAE